MKIQTKATNRTEYLASLEEPRKTDILALDALIQKLAPKLSPFFMAGMLAYGPYHYKSKSGREGDWFHIGLSSNKQNISLHICAADENGYIADQHKEFLPKADVGKSCVRFKRLSDIDPTALKNLIKAGIKAKPLAG